MQPLQDDLWSRAAKDNSMTNAATVRRNLDLAITMRSAETELQNTIELRATASEIVASKPDGSRRQSEKKTILKHFLKGFLEGKSLAPKWRKKRISCETSFKTSIGNSSTSTTCNPIYIAGTILQLQITMEFCPPRMQRKTLETPFTMRNRSDHDPTMIQEWSDHTHETVSHPSHRRGRSSTFEDGLCMEKHRLSCICYLSKTHFVRDFLQNSIGNSSTSTTCKPIYIAGTILQLQITMEFCRPHMHEKHLKPHLQCGTDPTMTRPWSEHDPTTHETVSQPSHRRGRSSRFGDGLCMEKHRLSCICYLSKTHFVRDFLQNSIGNSSTSTTCNPIYSEGTILELQITMEFHRQLIHQHHLQPHLQCGNDPTVANHNGILSTAHARKTLETPFTMRNRSDHDPTMIRAWSDHTRDRLATVAPQR